MLRLLFWNFHNLRYPFDDMDFMYTSRHILRTRFASFFFVLFVFFTLHRILREYKITYSHDFSCSTFPTTVQVLAIGSPKSSSKAMGSKSLILKAPCSHSVARHKHFEHFPRIQYYTASPSHPPYPSIPFS